MYNSNSKIANLVINYVSLLGINLLDCTDDQGTPITQEHLTTQLDNLGMDLTNANLDQDLYLYLEPDDDIAMLIDGETWHNNPSEDQEDYQMYHLSFLGGTISITIN